MHTTTSRTRGLMQAARVSLALSLALGSTLAMAAGRVYSTTQDFNEGVLVGVSTVGNVLTLSAIGSTFPVLWIANAGEDSLTKFDTRNNKELARYRTWFGPAGQAGHAPHLGNAFAGAAPSRTAVDLDGNAYVLNRHFDGRSAVLVKVLADGGIDRNSNGIIDTSADTNVDGIVSPAEMLPLADSNGNGLIDPGEIKDERIAWAVRVPDGVAAPLRTGRLGRSLCIAPNGNLWVGLYNDSSYYEVSGVDGRTLRGPINVGVTPYGCLVDAQGQLFSANLGSAMGRLNTMTGLSGGLVNLIDGTYGIALDNNFVYFAGNGGNNRPYFRVNKTTLVQTDNSQGPNFSSVGISVDGNGDIVTGVYSGGGVTKYRASDGFVLCTNNGYPNMSETRGVIADADRNIWQVSVSGSLVAKYGANCEKLGTFPVGNAPYTYSDAAGLAARSITTRTGDWSVVHDGSVVGLAWGRINWIVNQPAGTGLAVSARASDNTGALSSLPFIAVTNGGTFNASGRFIELKVRFTANDTGLAPVLDEIAVNSLITICDVNADGAVDVNDISLIRSAIGQTPTANDPRDANGDRKITMLDARACVSMCARTACAAN